MRNHLLPALSELNNLLILLYSIVQRTSSVNSLPVYMVLSHNYFIVFIIFISSNSNSLFFDHLIHLVGSCSSFCVNYLHFLSNRLGSSCEIITSLSFLPYSLSFFNFSIFFHILMHAMGISCSL